MSDPSLLEDHLISSRPLKDRFPGMNSRVPHATQILFSFRTRLRCLAVYRVFATTLPLQFVPQSVPLAVSRWYRSFTLAKPSIPKGCERFNGLQALLSARVAFHPTCFSCGMKSDTGTIFVNIQMRYVHKKSVLIFWGRLGAEIALSTWRVREPDKTSLVHDRDTEQFPCLR